jgi:secreted trypsin-like serine protease
MVVPQSLRTGLRGVTTFALVALLSACSQSKENAAIEVKVDAGVLGGIEVESDAPDFSKSMVFLRMGLGNCSGVLLSDSTVITAAHCLDYNIQMITLSFGHNTVMVPMAEPTASGRKMNYAYADEFSVPASFDIQSTHLDIHDLGLVKFSGGANSGSEAIKVLEDTSVLKNGAEVVVAGYGLSTKDKAKSQSGALRYAVGKIRDRKLSRTEVLIQMQNSTQICSGDSGGGAFIKVGDTWQLIGVTSRTFQHLWNLASACSGEVVVTLASRHTQWITEATKKLAESGPRLFHPSTRSRRDQP